MTQRRDIQFTFAIIFFIFDVVVFYLFFASLGLAEALQYKSLCNNLLENQSTLSS